MTTSLLPSRTNSPHGVRLGSQEPRLRSVPAYVSDKVGREAVDFMAQIGRPLDPWQAQIVTDTFARREDGRWAAREIVALVPRQNGKGAITEAQELFALFVLKERMILHSAHLFPTAMQAFQRLRDIIEGSAWLSKRVQAMPRSKGGEGIILTKAAGGGSLLFVARTEGGARGFTGSRLIFDEAYALTAAQYAAQTPTLATIPNHQITYTSTPPDEDLGPMPEDAMLPSVRSRGKGGDPRVAYYEWSMEPGADEANPDTWYACNPAAGIRIEEEFFAAQLAAFTAAGKVGKFQTEHLGVWPPDANEQWQVIPERLWTDAGDADHKAEGGRALGISMAPDRSRTFVASYGKRADGLHVMQLVEQFPGSSGVVEFVRAAKADPNRPICAVVIGASDPARSLLPDFAEAGIDVLTPGTADVAAECGSVYDRIAGKDVEARTLRHRKQGPLTAAMAATAKRTTGRAWIWNPNNEAAPLFAVTAASYGFRVSPPSTYDPMNNIW